jgi:hypothetical protein
MNVTVPVGLRPGGALLLMVAVRVTAPLGPEVVSFVVVGARFSVWVNGAEVLVR